MRKLLIKKLTVGLVLMLVFNCVIAVKAQTSLKNETFEEIKILLPDGKDNKEAEVEVRLGDDAIEIVSPKSKAVLKSFKYAEIKNAEYSYSKNPRWKTGLGLGAASIVFPPLLLVAIPVGFSKHRRHWLTIQTDKDYAVLKLSKSVRKLFIPSFESHSSVEVKAVGDNK